MKEAQPTYEKTGGGFELLTNECKRLRAELEQVRQERDRYWEFCVDLSQQLGLDPERFNNLSTLDYVAELQEKAEASESREKRVREALENSTSLLGSFINTEANEESQISLQVRENKEALEGGMMSESVKCPECGADATHQTPDGTYWDGMAHYWRKRDETKEALRELYVILDGLTHASDWHTGPVMQARIDSALARARKL